METSKQSIPDGKTAEERIESSFPIMSEALCAGCGTVIRFDRSTQPSLCVECEDKIRQSGTSWQPKRQNRDDRQMSLFVIWKEPAKQ